jgi:hypothetical protein
MALNLAISVLSIVLTPSASGGPCLGSGETIGVDCEDIVENGRFWRKSAGGNGVQPLPRWVPLSMDSRRRQDNAFRPGF